MAREDRFDELVAEGASVPLEGWDFSWFEGRATEERPAWGYARSLVERVPHAQAVLDVQTGGGEVFAEILGRAARLPGRLAATESWPPNLDVARRNLGIFGVPVTETAEDGPLPFDEGSFDLVVSRHPVLTRWPDLARVLRPGGAYISQQVGAGSNRELYEYLMGPQPSSDARSPERAVRCAEAAGLEVITLRRQSLLVVFTDVGAVVHFLRKVPWTVPGFTVEGYRDRLRALHERIGREGRFECHAQRFLIEAVKPLRGGTAFSRPA